MGKIEPGGRPSHPGGHIDIFKTVAEAAGSALPDDRVFDGVSLIGDDRQGADADDRGNLFWKAGHYRVVRSGNWKLQVSERPERVWLFDLDDDPEERTNLAVELPDRVAELRALLDSRDGDIVEPLWPALIENPVRIDVPLDSPWNEGQEYVFWPN